MIRKNTVTGVDPIGSPIVGGGSSQQTISPHHGCADKMACALFEASPKPIRRVRRWRPGKNGFSILDPEVEWFPAAVRWPDHQHWPYIPAFQN